MSKPQYSIQAVAKLVTAMFLCGLLFFKFSTNASAQKMKYPDFAYPKTVEKNASANLERAVAHGDWASAVEAIIQSVTASNLVSKENATAGIAKIDSVAALAPSDWKPALLLVKADIYNSIYNSIQWEANSRKIPTEDAPADPYEWSRDIFALKILDICKNILDAKEPANLKLKDWNKLIENSSDAFAYGMTVEEFLCERCFELLNTYADATKDVIPFFTNQSEPVTPGQKCTALRDVAINRLIDSASSGKRMTILAQALSDQANTLPYSLRMKAFLAAYDRVKDSEGEQIILANLRDYVSENPIQGEKSAFPYSTKEYIEMLRTSVSKFPKGLYANNLKNIINDLTLPSANISYRSQYLSSSDISMDMTLTNCNDAWILIYDYSPFVKATTAPKTREVAASCRLVKTTKASAGGVVPFSAKAKAEIGKLPKGTYVVIPSATPDSKGIYATILNDRWRQPFTVSDISVWTLKMPDAKTRVFVVDGSNGRPIEGAKVKVFSKKNYSSPRTLINTLTTDSEGSVTVGAERFEIEASFEGSKWDSNSQYYNSPFRENSDERINAQVLTNRALFHPGDSIEAAVIAYSTKNNDRNLISGSKYKVTIRDANYKEVASDSIVSDQYGRAVAKFKIPEQGLLGSWQIVVTDQNNRNAGQAYFQVADYVAPTFFIAADDSEEEVAPGDVMRLKGQVLTYSGMPVSGSTVKYNVTYRSPMRWWMHSAGSYDSSVTADADGKYVIELPTANLKGTPFERGIFTVKISATSPAGETQEGPTERFAIGNEFSISPYNYFERINISDSIPALKFIVNDMLGRPVKKELSYKLKIKSTNEVVAEGEFMSPLLSLPAKNYSSAVYLIDVALKEDTDVKTEEIFTFWRQSDKSAPEGTTLWVTKSDYTAQQNKNEVDVTFGSGIPDRWIYGVLSANGEILKSQWLHVEKDNITIPVQAPQGKQEYVFSLPYISNLDFERTDINIYSASKDKLQVATESFRDKISAGDKENWSFRFYSDSAGNVAGIPALAVMTDAALNAIVPFHWSFMPRSYSQGSFYRIAGDMISNGSLYCALKNIKYLPYSSFTFPILNDYNMDWGLGSHFGMQYATTNGIMRKNATLASVNLTSRVMADEAYAMVESVKNEVKMEDAEMEDGVAEEAQEAIMIRGAGSAAAPETPETTALRETECPVAFFMPNLVSDKDGIVKIDFTVPDFNTTWAFQLLGYDSELQVAKTELSTVASKPIMVSTHSPRFVRTGDAIELTATVFNNSGETCNPKCRIELVDLLSGKTITSKDFNPGAIEAAANAMITMSWDVPSNVSAVGFRAYAEASGHRDGEQALLPVLPASSPIVESTPFWIAPEGDEVEVKLPKFKESDQVTLQYCDNPAWYCISALPDIVIPDSKSVTAKSCALYGNAIAFNLISSNANLKKGLEEMLSDRNSQFTALKSNLEKDGNLKITQLNNTPWVNNAESETLRMSRLSSLLNDEEAKNAINSLLKDVRDMQSSDGGWSWCPDMEPSPFITQDVLRHFAMIMRADASSQLEDADGMLKAAIKYVDSDKIKYYKKYYKKGESLSYLLDWLFVRSSFPNSLRPSGSTGSEMNSIASKAYKDIASEWKDMGIGSKAKAAIVLWRAGDHKTANEILESLRQYASQTPEKGMWFDNLNSGWGGMSTLQTTTLVLEAFAEIQPSNKIVDALRQWLVLGRQYQDWGKCSNTVETVNAIMTSGTEWTGQQASQPAEFKLKGKTLQIPEAAKLTGAFTLTLNPKDASGKTLSISRKSNSPAWGGVISQYESPILDVVAAEVPDLSIRKSVVALVEGENGEMTPKEGITLAKGMKVRVTLFITAGRDMDYVAVTDERSACLEPTDQLSGYTSSDGTWFYREVRDTNTNLFFGMLPKGTHVVSYDCTVSQEGTFSCGIATIQSQYSPTAVAHSAGSILQVK